MFTVFVLALTNQTRDQFAREKTQVKKIITITVLVYSSSIVNGYILQQNSTLQKYRNSSVHAFLIHIVTKLHDVLINLLSA